MKASFAKIIFMMIIMTGTVALFTSKTPAGNKQSLKEQKSDTGSCIIGFGAIGGNQMMTKEEILKAMEERLKIMSIKNYDIELDGTTIMEYDLVVVCEGKDIYSFRGRNNSFNKFMKEKAQILDTTCALYFEHVIAKGPGGIALWPKAIKIQVK